MLEFILVIYIRADNKREFSESHRTLNNSNIKKIYL